MEMEATLAAMRAAFMAELPVGAAVRKDRLKRAIALVKDNADAFCDALSEDFGHRSRDQSMVTDIAGSVGPLNHALKHLDGWAKREKRGVQFPLGLLGARAWVEYQPKGVVGVIAPWNFPVNLIMAPLAGIFAAGNRAMVKTSEYTPRTSAVFEAACAKYFAADELAFFGGGPEAGKAFAALPFDHLIFTGATGIGRHILHAAADNLTPVTLELGGKSPVIVGKDADLRQATERVALGKMLNAGQICLAPDYLLVPAGDEPAVVEGLKSRGERDVSDAAEQSRLYQRGPRPAFRAADRLGRGCAGEGCDGRGGEPGGRGFRRDQQPQDAAPHHPRRDRRHDGDAGGDLRAGPAGA